MTAADVIAGKAVFSVECADAVAWFASLPEQSVDLVIGSPLLQNKISGAEVDTGPVDAECVYAAKPFVDRVHRCDQLWSSEVSVTTTVEGGKLMDESIGDFWHLFPAVSPWVCAKKSTVGNSLGH